MKILITNCALNGYTGTEVVVRDLALELKRQGHQPLVFSPKLGPISREISAQGIEVTSDLTKLTSVPDIIHAHHHPQTAEALAQFPGVPAVWVCHGGESRLEEPFYFPRILRYVAVDDRCRKRIEAAPRIPPSRIEVIWNAVDLERFTPRAALPAKPRRALIFSNYAHESTHLPAVRRACKRAGVDLDIVGQSTGTATPHPESVLPRYDIVFAKARCALESMAVGNAVVLCDFAGAGPLVTTENFDRLRRMNFGRGVLVNPLRPEHIEAEIELYDPSEAERVSQRIRKDAGLEDATHRWVALYEDVVREFRGMNRDADEELQALAQYLRRWNYEKRVEWEEEQLEKLRGIPVFGNDFLKLARRALYWWKQR